MCEQGTSDGQSAQSANRPESMYTLGRSIKISVVCLTLKRVSALNGVVRRENVLSMWWGTLKNFFSEKSASNRFSIMPFCIKHFYFGIQIDDEEINLSKFSDYYEIFVNL